jgi:hypothetical protein
MGKIYNAMVGQREGRSVESPVFGAPPLRTMFEVCGDGSRCLWLGYLGETCASVQCLSWLGRFVRGSAYS